MKNCRLSSVTGFCPANTEVLFPEQRKSRTKLSQSSSPVIRSNPAIKPIVLEQFRAICHGARAIGWSALNTEIRSRWLKNRLTRDKIVDGTERKKAENDLSLQTRERSFHASRRSGSVTVVRKDVECGGVCSPTAVHRTGESVHRCGGTRTPSRNTRTRKSHTKTKQPYTKQSVVPYSV